MVVLETYPPAPELQEATPASGQAVRRWRWTGDDVIRMGELGLLPHEGRFELLDGEIYQLMPPGPLHSTIVDLIGDLLEPLAASLLAHVREEKPIRLDASYDPQPDLSIVRGQSRNYRGRFPGPADLLLVIEVADSSLEHDRTRKLPAYAAAGIPECWLVNLQDHQVEVYRDPSVDGFRSLHLFRTGEAIALAAAPGSAVPVAELLGGSEAE